MDTPLLSLSLVLHICTTTYCTNYPSPLPPPPPCAATAYLRGTAASNCTTSSDCCQENTLYPIFHCSPPVTAATPATMVVASFEAGGSGGGASECDDKFHDDNEMVVSLSTGWYDHGRRCLKSVRITGNGRTVVAVVVDECDSVNECEADGGFSPPCPNDYVVASPAVWEKLGVPVEVGQYNVTWSDV